MRPDISVTLEPGLERGVPWGRDLYTFVTSAAGHMMRTLQKPRKNRPSKRQVNHRRFLHNMIQRKFADIEAANHRLASALYFKGEDKNPPEPPERLGDPDPEGFRRDPGESRDVEEVPDSGGKKQQDDSTRRSVCTSGKYDKNRGKREEERRNRELADFGSFGGLDGGEENASRPEDAQPADASPSFTPELSPLSLSSCDFAIQMFAESPQRADIRAESQWTDIMELLGVGGCLDVDGYFESICACQAGGDGEVEDGPADQSARFAPELEGRAEYACGYGGGRHGDQEAAEAQFDYLESLQCGDARPDRPPSSLGFLYDPDRPQEPSQCMLGSCGGNQNFMPFEGVAQSFAAPLPVAGQRPIQTPPHEDDWFFTDILKDRRLLEC